MSNLTPVIPPVPPPSYKDSAFEYEVAMGRLLGKSTVNKFGFNPDIDVASGEELIAQFGGAWTPSANILSVAQTFTITYNNTTDGSGQTGATQLIVSYLDANFELQSAFVVLGATGSDITSFTGLGINRIVVYANGGIGWNVNDITFTATTAGTIQGVVPALAGVTQQCIYHIPIGHTFLMNYVSLGVLRLSGGGGDPVVNIKIYSFSRFTGTRYLVFRKRVDTTIENHLELNFGQPFSFSGREVLYVTASTDKDNTEVTTRFSGILEINQ